MPSPPAGRTFDEPENVLRQGDRHMRTRDAIRRTAALGLAVGAIQVLLPVAASADPYADTGPNGGSRPDSDNHTWCFLNGSPFNNEYQAAYGRGASTLDSQTIMTSTFQGYLCDDVHVDVALARASSLPYGARGMTTCVIWKNYAGNICDGSDTYLSNAELGSDLHQIRKTSCHEWGHTVGLSHGSTDDCMRNGAVPAGSQYERYSQHHVDHVNNKK
jgi:hypothetical protein